MLCSNLAVAQEVQWSSSRPDGHAPISVMGDHYHKKNEVMFSYRYMPMLMDGSIQESTDISSNEIHLNYMAAPLDMQMGMHMIGFMYAPSNRITLAVMGNLLTNAMSSTTKMGTDFDVHSSGLGDIAITSLIKVINKKRQSLHVNIGVSAPVGNIDQRDATPMMDNAQLAYPMQLGSGTWDPKIGITYLGQTEKFSWGAQSNYKLRLGENTEEYSLGNQLNAVSWLALKISNNLSLSTSLSYFESTAINGADADMNPMMMPLFNTSNSGRSQLDIGVGTNYLITNGSLKNLRFAVEVIIPAYQKANGIQMKNTLMGVIGLQYAIGHDD